MELNKFKATNQLSNFLEIIWGSKMHKALVYRKSSKRKCKDSLIYYRLRLMRPFISQYNSARIT